MSASALRYQPAPDRNDALRVHIVALAHRHRRYGAGMIYLKLRQAGLPVNQKRAERLYTEARLQISSAQAQESIDRGATTVGTAFGSEPSLVHGLRL